MSILIIILAATLIYLYLELKKQNKIIQKLNEQNLNIHENNSILDEENKKLSIYKKITNVDKYCNELIEFTNQEKSKAQEETNTLTKELIAIENRINGYGTSYIVPNVILLDELENTFGYTQAGIEFKKAKLKTKELCEQNKACNSNYTDKNKRDALHKLITDYFNSKVDNIMYEIKKSDYGTLSQKIKDIFSLINSNGNNFRNVQITKEYLESRLEELKYGIILYELKVKQKEEQAEIKNKMREEEKLRKELEKQQQEALKEEQIIQKTLEKTQKEIDKIKKEQSDSHKVELNGLEDKIQELEKQLQLAEEKRQRALSMAQQTRSGHVYVISNIGSFGEDVYKIGLTRCLEPMDRIKALGDASVPFNFDVHAFIYSEDAPSLEKQLHKKFAINQINKVNPKKEFFKLKLKDIKDEIDKMNCKIEWTMIAEARQYYDSLALEEQLKTDKNKLENWIDSQDDFDNSIEEINDINENDTDEILINA